MKSLLTLIVAALLASGCTTGNMADLADAYAEAQSSKSQEATPPKVQTVSVGTIKYQDDSVMGVTRKEPIVNGGFRIYDVGTGSVVGFIRTTGMVNNFGGVNLGACVGAVVSTSGVNGDCKVPSPNPLTVKKVYVPVTDGTCPDTRNGDFNPSYSPSVCNSNGYFWCSIERKCLNKPINVNECGEMWTRG